MACTFMYINHCASHRNKKLKFWSYVLTLIGYGLSIVAYSLFQHNSPESPQYATIGYNIIGLLNAVFDYRNGTEKDNEDNDDTDDTDTQESPTVETTTQV
eukprot:m.10981 g.10981  ORF g.10981 m.10981 type:complete len:100 (+) comp4358_c0_seq1:421-720(+)